MAAKTWNDVGTSDLRIGFGGEVGHMPLEIQGAQCGCGRRGCWETRVGLTALLNGLADLHDDVLDPTLDVEQRLREVVRRAEAGEPRTLAALEQVEVGDTVKRIKMDGTTTALAESVPELGLSSEVFADVEPEPEPEPEGEGDHPDLPEPVVEADAIVEDDLDQEPVAAAGPEPAAEPEPEAGGQPESEPPAEEVSAEPEEALTEE